MNAYEYALQANGSFALPDACFKVKALMEDENSVITDFADIISIDPSMTSRLLQLANSAIYNFPGEISTISRAITIIGTQAVYNMMLVDLAGSAFKHFENQAINLKRFWRMSIYCGLVTRGLAIKAGVKDIERLFVAGLLQNFGELLVAKITPEVAQDCEQYNRDNLPWVLQEEALGYTYTDISAVLLKIWQLPEKIIIPIRHFHQAQSNQINNDVKILNLASRLALFDSHSDLFEIDELIDQSLCESLKLTRADIEQVVEIASKDAESILIVMNPKLFSR
ncbi:HDOD domain-containing protein [Colwellia sp. 4_MG-2023]|uniref:HDOD domain-containing protein n=1 Tax=unclassified Colwellia TaxID=196834 RepID=UPI001C09E2A3|nr:MULTISPECIES: HDOD domain-containing protein [unclassified Colwellia]MBU2925028.1 HDOD domain-containing protein [Colwellia sp. C2M11]MDO6486433.1 HDOD domain-containing protein [Colwellia sp. 6_MG-2023]MDO6506311.1 HDOD domain-containing protein [Colwellia sp. 5_MG-2023]MDO6555135.1 HDOD domain-containing protein [Colwellia sp. 4_MG-2023]MDO6651679.1 HDOD domain-containing protein [Colwellia sp. 3_MG-2023]